MKDLRIFNKDVIPVYTTDTSEKVVVGRELHERLGIETPYRKWFPRMCDYGFAEGIDYTPDIFVHPQNKQEVAEHYLKFDMAKHIAMIQRTDIGFKVRQKLIELEKHVTEVPSGPELLARAVLEADSMLKEQAKQIEEMKPKVIFADAVSTSQTCILVGDLAKLIKQNGVDIGQKRLFVWLRENDYLIKRKGADWNMPTQKSMEMGLFEVKESTVNNPDGSIRINRTTKVTGMGQQHFINKFLNSQSL